MRYLIIKQDNSSQHVVGMYPDEASAQRVEKHLNETASQESHTVGGLVPVTYNNPKPLYLVGRQDDSGEEWFKALVKRAWPR